MLWTIILILLVLWVVGLLAHVGNLIHLLPAAAFVVFVINPIKSRRTI
ncbi:MAG TPA: lmo0937 family membrane protein [Pyrinomonadaceae bacterium]|jgi:hypothetical protein